MSLSTKPARPTDVAVADSSGDEQRCRPAVRNNGPLSAVDNTAGCKDNRQLVYSEFAEYSSMQIKKIEKLFNQCV